MGQSAIKSDTNLVQIEAHDAVFMTAALLSPMHLGFDRFVTDSYQATESSRKIYRKMAR